MVDNPSVSMPGWMWEEIDSRRRTGPEEDDVKRSVWVREAVQARIDAEDAGEWTKPEITPPKTAATDGGHE